MKQKQSRNTQRGIAIGASIALESVEGLPLWARLKVVRQILTKYRTRLRQKHQRQHDA